MSMATTDLTRIAAAGLAKGSKCSLPEGYTLAAPSRELMELAAKSLRPEPHISKKNISSDKGYIVNNEVTCSPCHAVTHGMYSVNSAKIYIQFLTYSSAIRLLQNFGFANLLYHFVFTKSTCFYKVFLFFSKNILRFCKV